MADGAEAEAGADRGIGVRGGGNTPRPGKRMVGGWGRVGGGTGLGGKARGFWALHTLDVFEGAPIERPHVYITRTCGHDPRRLAE